MIHDLNIWFTLVHLWILHFCRLQNFDFFYTITLFSTSAQLIGFKTINLRWHTLVMAVWPENGQNGHIFTYKNWDKACLIIDSQYVIDKTNVCIFIHYQFLYLYSPLQSPVYVCWRESLPLTERGGVCICKCVIFKI